MKGHEIPDDRLDYAKLSREAVNKYELYNLEEDPGETKNLITKDPEILERLKPILMRMILTDPMKSEKIEMDEKLRKQLRSLGYLK